MPSLNIAPLGVLIAFPSLDSQHSRSPEGEGSPELPLPPGEAIPESPLPVGEGKHDPPGRARVRELCAGEGRKRQLGRSRLARIDQYSYDSRNAAAARSKLSKTTSPRARASSRACATIAATCA